MFNRFKWLAMTLIICGLIGCGVSCQKRLLDMEPATALAPAPAPVKMAVEEVALVASPQEQMPLINDIEIRAEARWMVLVISSSGPIVSSGSPSGIEKYQELRVTINNTRSGLGSAATFNLPGGLSVRNITLTETANGVSLVVRMRGMVNGPVEIRGGDNQVGILLTKDAQPEVLWSMAKAQPAQDWQVAAPPAQGSKQSAAVYMVGEEPPELNGAHKVIGAELAKALTASTAYIAVDRTQEGLNILAKEHIYQRSGAVDNEQIQELGKQLGVRYVCRAEISKVMNGYFLEARVVNVETAEMSSVATKYLNMASAEEVMRTAQEVSMELLSGKRMIANYTFAEIAANPDKAIADYTEAIRQEPDVADYYFKRGYGHYSKNDYDNAIVDYNEAIRLNPNDAVAYKSRGEAYLFKGAPDQVIVDCNKAIRLNPKFADAYHVRGMAYLKKNNYNKAIADFNKAIRLNPDYAIAYCNRGLAYLCKGDFNRAMADFNRVIRQYPNFAETYNSRGYLYSIKRDYDRAIADYNEAIRLDPSDAAYYNRGGAYRDKGDYDQAIMDFTEAIRLNPKINMNMMYNNRGVVYFRKKDYDRAIEDFNEAIRLNPNFAMAYHNRGDAYSSKGDYDQAIADFNEAIRLNPNFAMAYNNRGLAYSLKKEYNRAIADYTEAIRLNPNVSSYINRAVAYHKNNDFKKAIKDYNMVLQLNPNNPANPNIRRLIERAKKQQPPLEDNEK